MRSQDEVDRVLALVDAGLNDCEIARLTAVPRSTVREWRHGVNFRLPRTAKHRLIPDARSYRRLDRSDRSYRCRMQHDLTLLPPAEYSYLLGVYLGDGCVSAGARGVWRLRISMDPAYPRIIEATCRAMEAVVPGKHAHRYHRERAGYVEVSMYWKHWPWLLPQHGPGRKHLRRIALEPWQVTIVADHREALIRGLIHSDGCRVVANDRGVASVRYHFSNLSEDIKRIYCDSLDALGIPWTRPCDKQIAIYRKTAVAYVDTFVGPKR